MAQNKSITSSRFPYLPLRVKVNKNDYNLQTLIDTGFDGEIVLPPELVANGESPRRFVTCKLADNSVVEVPAYIGSVKLGAKTLRNIVVLVMGDEAVVGRGIVSQFYIILDYGRRVIVKS